jgi:hypothetical protein
MIVNEPASLLLIVCILWGMLFLGANFINEMSISKLPLTNINSFGSMLYRLGLAGSHAYQPTQDILNWSYFVKDQILRVYLATIPHLQNGAYPDDIREYYDKSLHFLSFIFIFIFLSLFAIYYKKMQSEERIILGIATISGITWAFLMKYYVAFHCYQAIFYVGIALTFYYLILKQILSSKLSEISLILVLTLSFILFMNSNIKLNAVKANQASIYSRITNDFQEIYSLLTLSDNGKNKVYIDGDIHQTRYGGYHAVDFYLSGNYFTYNLDEAKYIVSYNRNFNKYNLTPLNGKVFLFRNIKEKECLP